VLDGRRAGLGRDVPAAERVGEDVRLLEGVGSLVRTIGITGEAARDRDREGGACSGGASGSEKPSIFSGRLRWVTLRNNAMRSDRKVARSDVSSACQVYVLDNEILKLKGYFKAFEQTITRTAIPPFHARLRLGYRAVRLFPMFSRPRKFHWYSVLTCG
jgi:hypothetical protein